MKILTLIVFLFLNFLNADETHSNVNFTDIEINSTLYLCNYYSYQTFRDLKLTNDSSSAIIKERKDNLFTSISQVDSLTGINGKQLHYLKQESHLIDWNTFTDEFGMTLHQTNFLYGLTAVLIGFVFLFSFVQIVISEEYK